MPYFCPTLAAEQIISTLPRWRTWLMTLACETETKVCVIYCFVCWFSFSFLSFFLPLLRVLSEEVFRLLFFFNTPHLRCDLCPSCACVSQDALKFISGMGFWQKLSNDAAASQPLWSDSEILVWKNSDSMDIYHYSVWLFFSPFAFWHVYPPFCPNIIILIILLLTIYPKSTYQAKKTLIQLVFKSDSENCSFFFQYFHFSRYCSFMLKGVPMLSLLFLVLFVMLFALFISWWVSRQLLPVLLYCLLQYYGCFIILSATLLF